MKNKAEIGITGGIASGKSTASRYLQQQYNLILCDADIYAREAVEPGSEIWQTICDRYGSQISLPNGQLNRPKLGEIIFSNSQEREWLEGQIHPYVGDRFQGILDRASPTHRLVFSIPLLFEAKMTNLVQEVWVVYCLPQQQRERLMKRNNLSEEEAEARISSQMPLEQKCEKADRILDNSSTEADLLIQIDEAMASISL
ncbi:dephospho-CoA kinase [Roseofilum casamattae]|uniref:Dephospho-CoA kinase n=1 Tax=Roseofilum casamattae BLCC-M143 TaxID=3022442 RepID=A0ABT7BWS8_9CYAN|nr:dephospho-CoA kinase [Roseofilum casamattae]MDJ1183641.1 dephospho-CoA kinase [Roseofilum casamattae BLCC-M143]